MKWFNRLLILLLILLQAKLWFGEGSVTQLLALKQKVAQQADKNAEAHERNQKISEEVLGLQQGDHAVEGYARSELGLIKSNETFFIFVDGKKKAEEQKDTSSP